jgi:pyridoxal phosphate enzyme (YggS family)
MRASDVGTGLPARLASVRAAIDRAAERAGRSGDVQLVAVTKTVPAERILEAYSAGQRLFGENKVQEAVSKVTALSEAMPQASWHLIGHLQTNKANQALTTFSLIESVDSLRLAQRLDERAGRLSRRQPVLLEVNVAEEATKSGFTIAELRDCIDSLIQLPHLEMRGLMTVAPLVDELEQVRPVFAALRRLRDEIRENYSAQQFNDLSMGMSNDFRIAIEEGATMVRIGRAIFGERPPK